MMMSITIVLAGPVFSIFRKSIKENLISYDRKCNLITGRVKKSLFHNLHFWKEIDVYDSVFSMIKNGYSLDFEIHPPFKTL